MIAFEVQGVPATKGSARAVTDKRTGRALLLASGSKKNARDQRSWSTAVGWAAKIAMCGRSPLVGPLVVAVVFWLPRPESVIAERPIVKRDGDKLLRSTWDALTGIAIADDGQIVEWSGAKFYADGRAPGAHITIAPAPPARSNP